QPRPGTKVPWTMRAPADLPRRPRRRVPARLFIAVAVVALFVLLTSARGIAGLYTDLLWFDSLGFSGVWRRLLWARIGLFILSSLICFALLLGNLLVADRLSPVRRMGLPADPRLATVTAALRRAPLLLRAGLAAVFALLFG